MDIGKRIAELRTENGLSQQELADLLFVSRDLVSKWENGLRAPDYPTVERMAQAFGVSPDAVVDRSDLVFEELSACVGEELGAIIPEEAFTELVNRFLKKQSERNADLFLKRYYFLRTTAEIAAECGIRENHVRSILSKLRRRLRKEIREGHS